MSRARALASAIGSDGALNVGDVAGLAAVASSGSAADLTTGTLATARGGTGQTSYTSGQLLVGNAAGGLTKATISAGNGIAVTNGDGSILIATLGGGLPDMVIVSGTSQTAIKDRHYVLTNAAATTLTLPASPAAGDVVWLTVANGRTDNVIGRNGSNINSLAENMTIDNANAGIQLRYADATRGWIFT